VNSKPARPLVEPIELTGVWEMESIESADRLLGQSGSGFVYRRDGHPNATSLERIYCQWHGADHAITTAQGMSALSAAILALLKPGDSVLLAQPLYGKTSYLVKHQLAPWGIQWQDVDAVQPESWADALTPRVKMVIAETVTNPQLSVPDIAKIVQVAKSYREDVIVMVDNTFATPIVCQPLKLGADLVMESLSKFACGHGDVMLGILLGRDRWWSNIRSTVSTLGLASSPLDCWLTSRGLATLKVRMKHASDLAMSLALALSHHPALTRLDYPGLTQHPSHSVAKRQLQDGFGNMMTLHLKGGMPSAQAFMNAIQHAIPFCPSLGDTRTTLSHPVSTSHRSYTPEELARIGVDGGTIRFSCGLEEKDELTTAIAAALNTLL
jgi:cystathionine beta-lyase/cystathionine gamma-synthase